MILEFVYWLKDVTDLRCIYSYILLNCRYSIVKLHVTHPIEIIIYFVGTNHHAFSVHNASHACGCCVSLWTSNHVITSLKFPSSLPVLLQLLGDSLIIILWVSDIMFVISIPIFHASCGFLTKVLKNRSICIWSGHQAISAGLLLRALHVAISSCLEH